MTNIYAGLPGAGNLLNAILDPILIFFFHFGIGGAALATVISEYVNYVVNLTLLMFFAIYVHAITEVKLFVFS